MSKEAAQAGMAIDIARRLETALESLGAGGKGLHEKVGSIEDKLPAALVRKLRFVASVRNKIVHEDELLPEEEFSVFVETGRLAVEELQTALAGSKTGEKAGDKATKRPKAKSRKKAPQSPPSDDGEGAMASAGTAIRLGGLAFAAGIIPVFLLMLIGGDGPGLWVGAFVIYFILGAYVLRRTRRAAGAG